MARQKKDGKKVTYYLDQKIYDRLVKYADEHGQTMTMAIERILEKHLGEHETDVNKN